MLFPHRHERPASNCLNGPTWYQCRTERQMILALNGSRSPMIDKNKPNKAAADERIKNPKKVNKQTKEIAESSDDEDPRQGLARDRPAQAKEVR